MKKVSLDLYGFFKGFHIFSQATGSSAELIWRGPMGLINSCKQQQKFAESYCSSDVKRLKKNIVSNKAVLDILMVQMFVYCEVESFNIYQWYSYVFA